MTITELMLIVLVLVAISLLIITTSACQALASIAKSCGNLNVSITKHEQQLAAAEPSMTQEDLDTYYKEQTSVIDAAQKIQALFLDPDQLERQGDVK